LFRNLLDDFEAVRSSVVTIFRFKQISAVDKFDSDEVRAVIGYQGRVSEVDVDSHSCFGDVYSKVNRLGFLALLIQLHFEESSVR